MENKRAHLAMIQAVINRMSVNSFLLKGWSVVIVSALFALAASSSQGVLVTVALFPAVTFWALDGYFLRQERLFRSLFDRVRQLDDDKITFAMSTASENHEVAPWIKVALSKTLITFHGALVASILAVMIIVFVKAH